VILYQRNLGVLRLDAALVRLWLDTWGRRFSAFRVVLPPHASSPRTPRERVVIDSGMMSFDASEIHFYNFEKFW
jgi:hypothetical protein